MVYKTIAAGILVAAMGVAAVLAIVWPQQAAGAQAEGLPLLCTGSPATVACALGYVYDKGTPVAGAVVTVDGPFGSVAVTTANGALSSSPYFTVPLSSAPLLAGAGTTVTLQATYAGRTGSLDHLVLAGAQQVDVVIPQGVDDWWDAGYAYRRPLPLQTGSALAAGTLIQVNGLDLAPLIADGKLQPDYRDLRVVRHVAPGNWQEVARAVFSAWDVEFTLPAELPAGAPVTYYLYYGNSGAGTAPTFSLPGGWWVDMYRDKWWSEHAGTWAFNQAMDFGNVCDAGLDHDGRIGSSFDESDRFRGRIFIPTTGRWTFRLYTNDGYYMKLDGGDLGNFSGYTGDRWVTLNGVDVKAGWHRLELGDMWVNCGAWRLAMEGPSFANQIVPASYFQQVWDNVHSGVTPGAEEALAATFPPIVTFVAIAPGLTVSETKAITLHAAARDDDEDGQGIAQVVWRSDQNGLLGTGTALTLAPRMLPAGAHTLYVKARDDEGVWSPEVARTIQIVEEESAPPTHTPTATPSPTPTATATSTATPTATPTAPAPPPPGTGDAYEVDDGCLQARVLAADGVAQSRTFHHDDDVDWAYFAAQAGHEYRVEVRIPPGSAADADLTLYLGCEQLPEEHFGETFTPAARLTFSATVTGAVYLRLAHQGAATDAARTYSVQVNDLTRPEQIGAAIIVAGRVRRNDPLQANIHRVAGAAYVLFQNRGYTAEDIYLLANDPALEGYDAPATAANLAAAITQWASGRVDSARALTLYLVDHGNNDFLYLDEVRGERVYTRDLDGWLAQLEASAPGVKVNVVVEACFSGSFIRRPDSLSRPGRAIVTSAGSDEVANASHTGAHFSDHFMTGLEQGRTLLDSWQDARATVQKSFPRQRPLLDVDGNGIPNEAADEAAAAARGFGRPGTLAEKWPPFIAGAEAPEAFANGAGTIAAEVRDDRAVTLVWAIVYPPSYQPPAPGEELAGEPGTRLLFQALGENRYAATYPGFNEPGHYRIVLYAVDGDGLAAVPVTLDVAYGRHLYLPAVQR